MPELSDAEGKVRMSVTDLVASGYLAALDAQKELHEAWNKQSFKVSEISGIGHLAAIQSSNRLDLLLRQLEAEYEPAPEGLADFSLDFRFGLAECWVLRVYEIIRAASMQLRLNGKANEKVATLKQRIGLVRIPMAKVEIQGMGKKNSPVIVLTHEDGTGAKEYANDGTYVIPRQVCADTGSPMWCPVNVNTNKSEQIRRIDLSNEFLTLFD